jgi:ABC-type uncharacterized transport system involved in gliding motility auxiliary subunit
MKARQTKYAVYLAVYVVIIVTVLVVANVLANRYNKTFDATSNKRFSLSDQTKKVIKESKDDINIVYFDKPTGFQPARDLLDRYADISSKVHVEYVDAYKNPQRVRAAGIKREGTAIVEIGNKKEEARTFDEEGVTGALIRDIKGGERLVCVATGSGEHQLEDSSPKGFSQFKELVGKDNYKTQSINLLQKAEVPSTCTVLVAPGPKGDYIEPAVNAIKVYVENGGRALIMLDPVFDFARESSGENAALIGLLTSWGVTVEKNLVLDENPVSQMFGTGPEVPLVTKYESHPIVSEMNRATGFPVSRSLEIKNGDKTTVAKLFGTGEDSFATTNLGSPEIRIDPKKDKHGPFTLGAAGTYNTGKPNSQGRFVVVGSGSWAGNSFLKFNGNRDLALNMMNWLSSDEDLISIHRPEPEDRRINLSRAQMIMIRWVSQAVLPLIVILGGIMVWWKRR